MLTKDWYGFTILIITVWILISLASWCRSTLILIEGIQFWRRKSIYRFLDFYRYVAYVFFTHWFFENIGFWSSINLRPDTTSWNKRRHHSYKSCGIISFQKRYWQLYNIKILICVLCLFMAFMDHIKTVSFKSDSWYTKTLTIKLRLPLKKDSSCPSYLISLHYNIKLMVMTISLQCTPLK